MQANPNATIEAPAATFVPVGSQVTVTIGRNVGSKPMPLYVWREFQLHVRGLLRDSFAPSLEFGPFEGEGRWDGVTETSAVLIAVTSYPGSTERFARSLVELARGYGQEAIAWSFGPNNLATV